MNHPMNPTGRMPASDLRREERPRGGLAASRQPWPTVAARAGAEGRVYVFVDYQNIYLGLRRRGLVCDPHSILDVTRKQAERRGRVVQISLVDDWVRHYRETGEDVSALLSGEGVTCVQVSALPAKNGADMRLANLVSQLLRNSLLGIEVVDSIVLASSDRDYRPVCEETRAYGKYLLLLAISGDLSLELQNVVDEVQLLDQLLALAAAEDPALSPASGRQPLAGAALRLAGLYHDPGQPLKSADLGMTLPVLERLVDERLLVVQIPQSPPGARPNYWLNLEHPLVQAARRLRQWLPSCIRYALKVKQLPFVGTRYLLNGMAMDSQFRLLEAAPSDEDALAWLDLAVEQGIALRRLRPSARQPERLIRSWLPPEAG